MNSHNEMNSSDGKNSHNKVNSSDCMNSHSDVNSSDCMNSHSDMNSSCCMNSHKDMNSSEYMILHNDNNDMNSSDYENSYVLPSVFVPDVELDGLINGYDKSNTLDNTSEMNIDTDCIGIDTDCIDADCITKDCINAKLKHANCIDIDHTMQICTIPIHMI